MIQYYVTIKRYKWENTQALNGGKESKSHKSRYIVIPFLQKRNYLSLSHVAYTVGEKTWVNTDKIHNSS